ncbi:putative leucine-rich repeat receptor-like protein kinase [Forsythia ovata]|uniref:Leucine-rich repeat receptor-like protein kinase n=1 Tax=Forsythia ovata TaxID=205694 RepID=A0ABD1WW74_9LAMI
MSFDKIKLVSRLVLENMNLQGQGLLNPLTSLTQLRVLSLKQNNFSGPNLVLSNVTSLKFLFLSYNEFSGDFPVSVAFLWKLYQLDLSYNNLSSIIPSSLNHLTHLLTLRLEENRFSGSISGLSLPSLQDFNVSGNVLAGEIPNSLSKFFALAFEKNSVLCGVSLEKCKLVSSDPTWPWAMASPLSPKSIVASSPSSMPVETKTLKKDLE